MNIGKCELWTGQKFPNGYGRKNVKFRCLLAHRYVYEKAHGKIPAGLVVRHKCDNRLCVRLSHLELGTHKDNIQDMIKRGRARYAPRDGQENPNYRHGRCCGTAAELRAYHADYERNRRRQKKEEQCPLSA